MREILFRGKRKDNREWIEGGIYYQKSDDVKEEAIYIIGGSLNDVGSAYEVIPETVGQYTGLTDKNGKRIFEGDIVKHHNQNPIKEFSIDIGSVFYYSKTCRFLRTSKLFPDECLEINSICEYEVIGNIHDNPELLKGE